MPLWEFPFNRVNRAAPPERAAASRTEARRPTAPSNRPPRRQPRGRTRARRRCQCGRSAAFRVPSPERRHKKRRLRGACTANDRKSGFSRSCGCYIWSWVVSVRRFGRRGLYLHRDLARRPAGVTGADTEGVGVEALVALLAVGVGPGERRVPFLLDRLQFRPHLLPPLPRFIERRRVYLDREFPFGY